MSHMITPLELTDLELDAVSGGQIEFGDGLVQVGVLLEDIEVNIPITIQDVGVQVGVAAFDSRVIQRQL
jgi:hypothetical protein